MALSRDERERFLAEPHIGALSVEAEEGRAPLTVPVWYLYEPGGTLRVLTGRDSRKAQLIRRAGRFSVMAERLEPTVRYVSVEGEVVEETEGTGEDLRKVSAHYLPADKVDGYVKFAEQEHGAAVVFHLRPQRWLSSDLGTI